MCTYIVIFHTFVLSHLAAKGLGTVAEKVAEKVDKLKSLAKIVPGLSVIAGAFGLLQSLTKPTTQDIIDKVNEGFQKFVSEVNQRLSQTKDYVDSNIVREIKDLATSELKRMENMWMHCLTNPLDEDLKRCQKDKVK